MISYSIYVVDDEELVRDGIALALKKHYRVRIFHSAEAAMDAIEGAPPDLLLLDVGLAGMSGIDALREIKRSRPEILVIMITAYEDVGTVVSAMRLGAYDYVVKPLNMEGLLTNIRNALDSIEMRKEIQALQERCLKENLPYFIGESNAIQDVMVVVKKVAPSPDTPILIQRETGTGKELIVSAIHYRSPNFHGPLVTVNCAAIPKGLIESELFGYEKGAFSGADTSGKMGLVEKATDGTLFLDEVGDLSPEAQAKLLRFIEEGEYYRVGGTRKRQVRTRVISATNRDLEQMVVEGAFRRDLYYRLAVVKVEVPTLNDRREDIVPMARHFLAALNKKLGRSVVGISLEAEQALKGFHWKGNVRELRNVMERGVLLASGPELTSQDLGLVEAHRDGPHPENTSKPPPIPDSGIDFSSVLESLEKHYIRESLRMAHGNESKAARLLHLSRDTFRYRKRKHHVA